MTRLSHVSLVLIWVLIIGLCSIVEGRSQPNNCHYEEIPSTFDLPSYLGFNDEFHIQGEYYVNLTKGEYNGEHTITFKPRVDSLGRFYVAPHDADVDLWLYPDVWTPGANNRALKHSLSNLHEETIEYQFTGGQTYTLRLNFFKAWMGLFQADECETILFEAQMIPLQTAKDRMKSLPTSQDHVPNGLNFQMLPNAYHIGYQYDSSNELNNTNLAEILQIRSDSNSDYSKSRMVNQWLIQLPSNYDSTWLLEASVGAEFLYGGSFGLFIATGEYTQLGNIDLSCLDRGNCTVGHRRRMNEHSLSIELMSGRSYTLVLFDRTGQRNNHTSGKAVPFSMVVSLTPSKSSGTGSSSCNSPLLPTVLPGYFEEPKGWFHYNEKVLLNLSVPTNTIYINVREKAYFRVHTLAHRVDIDLRLRNGTREIASELAFGSKAEAIATVLEAGTYELKIIYYGVYETKPCETFSLEIALEPISVSAGANSLTCPTNNLPQADLGSFPRADGQNFVQRGGPYLWDSGAIWTVRDIHTIAFTVTKEIHFKATLGFSFVLYDLNLKLKSTTASISGEILGEPTRNRETISTTLQPGSYRLTISTSHAGSSVNPLVLPKCAEFDLIVEVYNSTSPTYQYSLIPTDLRMPGYLGRGDFVHFADEVLLPITNSGSWTAITYTTFNVTKNSVFRVWAEPHDIDIDFELRENGLVIATNLNIGTEETIMKYLTAGKRYELRTHYYRFGTPGANHRGWHTANMELAIAPQVDTPAVGAVSLPPTNYIPDFDMNKCRTQPEKCKLNQTSIFSYRQTSTALAFPLHFRVTGGSVRIRVVVQHDFLYGDLSMELYDRSRSTVTPIHGQNYYNRYELTQTLNPINGNYSIIIKEAAVSISPRWTGFQLSVTYESTEVVTSTSTCPATYLPYSLNSPGYLSDLSAQQVHFARNLLVPPLSYYRDYMKFNLNKESLVSIVVPEHSIVDVDVALRNGTMNSPGDSYEFSTTFLTLSGYNFMSLTSYNEESAHVILKPGTYFLEMRFFPQPGRTLPRTDCFYYPAQIAVVPMDIVSKVEKLKSTCNPVKEPPTSLTSVVYNERHSRNLNQPFNKKVISFTVPSVSFLEIDIFFNFPTGAISMSLAGSTAGSSSISGGNTLRQPAIMGQNRQTLHRLLAPGSYNITLHDPFEVKGRATVINGCSDYQIFYTYTAATPDEVSDDDRKCLFASTLPADLADASGGSAPFGGPQAADGTVRIYGSDFLLDEGEHYMSFQVKEKSYVRAFAQGNHEEDDVDFIIYKDNVTTPAISYSMGVGHIESSPVKLSTPGKYVLDINVWDVGEKDLDCPLFHFEFALRTEAKLKSELACPILPADHLPPTNINVASVASEGLVGTYYLTKDDIARYTSGYRMKYRITVVNKDKDRFIYAGVLFDFLANDFRISISDSQGRLVESGVNNGLPRAPEYINFESWLFAQLLKNTTYYLDIEEFQPFRFDFPSVCHKFEFEFFNFDGEGDPSEAPFIDMIYPESGEIVEPNEDLWVYVDFSEPVGTPDNTQRRNLLKWVKDNSALYLKQSSSTSNILPVEADMWEDSEFTYLDVRFQAADIVPDRTFTIHLDASKFKDTNGVSFVNPLGSPTFSTSPTDFCNNHGNMVNGVCQCNAGYTGARCDQCATGYHQEGQECKPDAACPADYCHGHGECVPLDSERICFCNYGYAGRTCEECAYGFEKDSTTGECKLLPQEDEEPIQCEQSILPTSLDAWGYLLPTREVHLSEDFYLDHVHGVHEMTFSLERESVFRILAEPHKLDIDIWLYKIDDQGNTVYLDALLSLEGVEEVMYKTLPGGTPNKPAKYLLKFQYFDWEDVSDTCHSAYIELAIVPKNRAQGIANKMAAVCTGTESKLPTNQDIFGKSNRYPRIESDMTLKQKGANFIVAKGSGKANYAGKIDFEIVTANPWSMATIHATTSSQFAIGDVALLLESGDNADHCTTKGAAGDNCVLSSPTYNGHTLHQNVSPGKYTLWFYEPVTQIKNITSCAVFDFAMEISMNAFMDDLVECDGTELPFSFNQPGYVTNGYMHVVGDFLAQTRSVSLTVPATSVFRIAATSWVESLSFTIKTESGSVLKTSRTADRHPEIVVQLFSGKYTVEIRISPTDADYCPMMRLEAALKPQSDVKQVSCSNSDIVLPKPVFLGSLPYGFGSTDGKRWKGRINGNLVMDPVNLHFTSSVFLAATVVSDFLTSGFKLVVRPTNDRVNSDEVWGEPAYNSHEINTYFAPGNYTLQVRSTMQPQDLGPNYPSCGYFDLDIEIFSLGQIWNYPCNRSGDVIPNSFMGMQHLGGSDRFTHAAHYRVPPLSDVSYVSRSIPFNVSQRSFIRVKTEPHDVDVDISLVEYTSDGRTNTITHGGYLFNEEESFINDSLVPGKRYAVVIQFWKFNEIKDECPVFVMHTAIAPVADLAQVRATCPENKPMAKAERTLHYSFDSSSPDSNPFSFVQKKGVEKSFSIEIEPMASSDIVVQIQNDFTSADLSVTLEKLNADGVTVSEQYYGLDFGFGATIRQWAISSGKWKVTVYQTQAAFDGCVEWNLLLAWKPADYNHGRKSHLTLPMNLNGAGDLAYDDFDHFAGVFSLFHSGQETIEMSLREPSLVRVSTDQNNALSERIEVKVQGRSSDYSYLGEHTGRVTLSIDRPDFTMVDKHADVGVEIAVFPMSWINQLTSSWPVTKCEDNPQWKIELDPNGHYQYDKDISLPSTTTTQVIQSQEFTLKKESFVHVSIGFDFINSDLEIEIQQKSGDLFHGKNSKNHHEFRQVLPANTYTLIIRQYNNIATSTSHPSLCSKYHLRVYIGDAKDAIANADCASAQLVPWNLNLNNPSRQMFNVFGENFLMRGDRQIMYVNVSSDSILSLFTDRRGGYDDVTYHVYKTHPQYRNNPESAVFTANGQTSRDALFKLPQIFDKYEIELVYAKNSLYSKPCPSFGMQLVIAPKSYVAQSAACPTKPTAIGQLKRQVDVGNTPTSVYFDGSLNGDFVTAWYSPHFQQMIYNTSINVTRQTDLVATAMYDDLLSHFEIVLYRNTSYGVSQSIASNRRIFAQESHVYNAQHTFSFSLWPGNYIVALRAKVLSAHAQSNDMSIHMACYPLLYTLQFVPSDVSTSVVRGVTPPTAKEVNPGLPLSLEIDFPSVPRAGNSPLSSNMNALKNILYLIPAKDTNNNNNAKREANEVACNSIEFVSPVTYKAKFLTNQMQPGIAYKLESRNTQGEIKTDKGVAIQLVTYHRYTVADTNCNGHGVILDGTCRCEEGYAGASCQLCADGYKEEGGKCVKNSGFCRVDSCGCNPLVPDYCVPIGTCKEDNSDRHFHCECPRNYAGDLCDRCAKGYDHFELGCTAGGSCKCDHCDRKTCVCDEGWAGELCDRCDDGYSGLACEIGGEAIKSSRRARIAGGLLGAIVILATAGFVLWNKYGKNQRNPYMAVDADMESAAEMSLFDDDDDQGHHRFEEEEENNGAGNGSTRNEPEPEPEQKLFSLDD
ncbi:hypothetical protein PROFUN_13150 [Planoprotostelium fungivorum]|uniref:EGF-like domain-containing protein n=1 Tax=Planoprotostelium fungivorum TaxID=1890364 RepID=A0A2P6N570_9EUKA|nr:hypothetical protein PROFUN_13150 [Planoprotostelium fungivorum]